MKSPIPSGADVKKRLAKLSIAELGALSRSSKTPYSTLIKIRYGTTTDPGIETVRRFWSRLLRTS